MVATTPTKDALQRLMDALQALIKQHLELARVEIKQDAREMGRDLVVGAAGMPALAVGYLFLMFALANLLMLAMPAWAGYGLVALLNLGAGALLSGVWGRRALQRRIALRKTAEELHRDRAWLATLKDGTAPARPEALATRDGTGGVQPWQT